MASYDPVPLPTCGPNASTTDLALGIGRWITSRPLRDLVEEFGGGWPDLGIGELLDWLDDFSASHWDFRRGAERDEVRSGTFQTTRVELVRAAAGALGLSQSLRPPRRAYRHLLVLGGLARACLVRTAYAADLISSGGVEVGDVAALGSFRELREPETGLLAELGMPGCLYEVDAMAAGARAAFGFTEPQRRAGSTGEVTHSSWSVETYRQPPNPLVEVLAAPSSEPAVRRATTPDTYHFWARRVELSPEDCVLVVTTPIYVPFQHCDAVRALGLPYGCSVDTVGFDPAFVTHPLLRQEFDTDRYLQELRSAIRSIRDLHRDLHQGAPA